MSKKEISLKTQIVILDAYPANPGDLSWKQLYLLGEVTIYPYTPSNLVASRIKNAEIVLTNKVKLDRKLILNAPKLKYIGSLATGFDVIDIKTCRERGIVVSNIPGYSTKSTAQHAIAMLLSLTNHIGRHHQAVQDGEWTKSQHFAFWHVPLIELANKHMVIVGYGAIGSSVAKIARALGMKVSAMAIPGRKYDSSVIPRLSIEESFKQADVLSLHCPLTPETEELVNRTHLTMMKKTALIVNVARGKVVNDQAVADALHAKQIAGYATDVLTNEPPLPSQPLLFAPKCLVTPHIAWATTEARTRLLAISIENVRAFLEENPINQVIKLE